MRDRWGGMDGGSGGVGNTDVGDGKEAVKRERLWGHVVESFLPWFEALVCALVGMVVLEE